MGDKKLKIFTSDDFWSGKYGEDNKNITVPDEFSVIGEYAMGNSSVKVINLSEKIKYVNHKACHNCQELKHINTYKNGELIKDYIDAEIIGNESFDSCHGLKKLTIGSSVRIIGSDAFNDCRFLEELIIEDGVKEIGEDAFRGCSNLVKIIIPRSVELISCGAFSRCGKLESIIVDKSNNIYSDGGGSNVLIEKEKKKIICGCKTSVIPEGIEVIGTASFDCVSFRGLTIPNSVKRIDGKAFVGNNAEEIYIPDSVEYIGKEAFYCAQCQKVRLSENELFDRLATDSFGGCNKLKELFIPNNVKHILPAAFEQCRGLKFLSIPGDIDFGSSTSTFFYVDLDRLEIRGEMSDKLINYISSINAKKKENIIGTADINGIFKEIK